MSSGSSVVLGLRANWQQFSLLVLINAFVGGMVGLQGTVVPLVGSQEFKIASTTAVLSFIVSFGVIKAFANLVSGHLADTYGRKHMLVLGWLIGLPVPFMRLGAELGVDCCCKRASRHQSRILVVNDCNHEGRPCRPKIPRACRGTQ
jgi:MFS family permease